MATADAYDEVPYSSLSYPLSSPAWLATIATVFGQKPPAAARGRVLELGCASGGNLIPLAEQLPAASFLGVDVSERQVAEGNRALAATGLGNVRILQMDLCDVGEKLGEFDYIIAHGVYSWVAPPVRQRLLEICKARLAPTGVAYVSYNTHPGWKMRGLVRDLMLYRARGATQPKERLQRAREVVDVMARSLPKEKNGYGLLLEREAELLRKGDERYLLHDHLEEHNEPVYFHEFVEHARSAGLQYLGDAEFKTMWAENLPRELRAAIATIAADRIELEQYMDFLRNRAFRQTLLCHDGLAVDATLAPERLLDLHAASRLKPDVPPVGSAADAPTEFRANGVTVRADHESVRRALHALAECWPRSCSVRSLLATAGAGAGPSLGEAEPRSLSADARQVLGTLLGCFRAGEVELSVRPACFVTSALARPRATPYARYRAKAVGMVTNLRHENVRLQVLERHVLQLLDGSRDVEAIKHFLVDLAKNGVLKIACHGKPVLCAARLDEVLVGPVRAALQWFAANALLSD